MKWRFLDTGFNSGSFNMHFDELLARNFIPESDTTLVRVYGWSPHTISLGFNQNENDFDLTKIKNAGIEIVRRPTGGRAIFHAHELTYSVVIALDSTGPREIYHAINRALLTSLQALGINAQLSAEDENFKHHYQSSKSIPCFSSSAKNEIHYDGKKLIGSAQRKFGNVILQHGSFLLGTQHRELTEYLAGNVLEEKRSIENAFISKTIEAETILNRKVSFYEAKEVIKKGFEREFSITFEEIDPKTLDITNSGKVA
ncbi:MAG: lipoate--protein ligase family protein [Ignavibacteriales bacterium]|nr:lipoate--protein ligase family protein [Ignavibacteriales bacterium]